jgi:hypothetical protein
LSADGKLAGKFSVTHALNQARRTAMLQFRGLNATADRWPLRGIEGELTFRQRRLDIAAKGKFQQAVVRFTGQAILGERLWEDPSLKGELEVRELELRKLASLLPLRSIRTDVRGFATARLDVTATGPAWEPSGKGRVTVRELAWGADRLSETVQCGVALDDGVLQVDDLAARLAGGEVRANLSLDLRNRRQGTFSLRADRLELAALTRPWSRKLPEMRGRVSLALRGSLGQQWRTSGSITLDNGELASVPLELRRAALDATFVPRNGNLEGRLQLASAELASGRLTGQMKARWSGRLELEGALRLRRAQIRELARATDQLRNQLSGRLDGRVDFKGTDIDSLESMEGTFEARLFQTQALSLPVLEALAGSLGVGAPSSERFGETVASGDFRRGILHLDRMTMESPQAKLSIDGTVTRRGRLDLDVTADTAQLAAAGVALGFLRPLDFLRRRLLFLHVGGSIRSPIVQPRTAEMIEQELILFFLPLATPAAPTP